MTTKIYTFLVLFVLLSCRSAMAQIPEKYTIASGPFEANWESFEQHYQFPKWFSDAKFGIWAHWSAQCVPEAGDWYARHIYIQAYGQYDYHLKKYGHPSQFGFMELDNLWKAENWDPEKLMKMYKKAGAKYFVTLANHHDNFDNYDSKYHAWNSLRVGPKKDIVGTWEKITRANGLHFGVSNHSAHAWHWLQPAYTHDVEGPLAGVKYDAARLTKADGKGKWWEGLDPQELYCGQSFKMPDSIKSIKVMQKWHEDNDRHWNESAPDQNPDFTKKWFLRCQDLVDKYHPDLVYFDDFGLPLGQTGKDIVAHIYNADLKRNKTSNVVVNAKNLEGKQNKGIVEDFERGYADGIKENPWQTCTCIGDWHYNREVYEQKRYKAVKDVLYQLIDIVSKNGNLLLSIPMRADGTIDDQEQAFLEGMGKWMEINQESIFGTRPFKVFGEGPTMVKAGMFNENSTKFTSKDIRFTTKEDVIYAQILGADAKGTFQIKSLGKNTGYKPKIKSIQILGYKGKIKWKQDENSLTVEIPDDLKLEHTIGLKIK